MFLGLFPSLDDSGGLQIAGRLAWEAILGSEQRTSVLNCPVMFSYDPSNSGARIGECVAVQNKWTAVWSALGRNWPATAVLVWHLHLLRLLPFMRIRKSKVLLMLMGIEAWKSHSFLIRNQLRRVDGFLSISDHTWNTFVEFYPELSSTPHRTVPLGIDEPRHDCAALPTESAAVMIGRMRKDEDYKGHREVLEAWPEVLRSLPGARLWIVGDGDLIQELKQLALNLCPPEAVQFTGYLDEETKRRTLERARCLLMPSRNEGFGLVYLEAMRLARPCLVSTLDAGREVVNPPEAGLAVDPGNGSALAASIIRLISPGQEWENWSSAAKRRYEALYTAEKFQQRFLEAVMSLL